MSAEARSPRALAGRVGANVSLVDLRLKRVDAELLDPNAELPLSVRLELQPTFGRDEDAVGYVLRYELLATDTDGDNVFRANIEFALTYTFDKDFEPSEEELGAFAEVSVAFSAHPYVREIIHSLTTRVGLPPLVIDVLKSPLDDDPDVEVQAVEDPAQAG